MKQKTNELMIGISVTIASLIVILSILWLGKSNFFVKGLHIDMLVTDAQGLNVGDEVFYSGLSIGSVQSAEITARGILFELKIEHVSQIPKDSKFSIKEENLLGGKAVDIRPGNSTQYLKSGDMVIGEKSSSLINALQNGEEVKNRINKVLTNIDSLTGSQTLANLQTSLALLNSTIKDTRILLDNNQKGLTSLIANLDTMTSENRKPLHNVITSLSRKSQALSEAIVQTQSVTNHMDSILIKLQSGQGSMGKLLMNDSLYNNMNRSFAQLDSLLYDIRKNPKKYFEVKVF